jgi:hypothetical protein
MAIVESFGDYTLEANDGLATVSINGITFTNVRGTYNVNGVLLKQLVDGIGGVGVMPHLSNTLWDVIAAETYNGSNAVLYHFAEGTSDGWRAYVEEATTLYGLESNDTLDGFSGYALIDGGNGLDTVKYSVGSTKVSFSANDAGQLVIQNTANASAVESDALVSMERIQFTDTAYALDSDGNAGIAAKVIITTFGADSISTYMSAALSVVDSGTSLEALCDLVVELKLIDDLVGSSSNAGFVGQVFNNVVGRNPNLLESKLYTSYLDNGTYTKSSLLALAANTTLAENLVTANSIDLIGVAGSADGEILALQYDLGLG